VSLLSIVMTWSPNLLTWVRDLADGRRVPVRVTRPRDDALSQQLADAWCVNHMFCLKGRPEAGRLRLISECVQLRKILPTGDDRLDCWQSLTDLCLTTLLFQMDRGICCAITGTKFECDCEQCEFHVETPAFALHDINIQVGNKGRLSFEKEIQKDLKKKTETVRDTCHRVSRRHFGERHLVDDVCPGQATLSTTLLDLPPLLPIWLSEPNHTWKVSDMPRSLTLSASHGEEKYSLTAVHLYNGTHFTGNIISTSYVLCCQYQPCHVFVTRCRKFSCGQC